MVPLAYNLNLKKIKLENYEIKNIPYGTENYLITSITLSILKELRIILKRKPSKRKVGQTLLI